MSLNVLSLAAFIQGDLETGVRLGYESAALAESVGFTWWRGVTLAEIAEHLFAAGDHAAAAAPLADGLESIAAVDDRVNLPLVVAAAAAIAAQRSRAEQSGLLWGAVEAAAEFEPRPTTDSGLAQYAPYLEPVRGPEFDEARDRGRALSLDEAASRALSYLRTPWP